MADSERYPPPRGASSTHLQLQQLESGNTQPRTPGVRPYALTITGTEIGGKRNVGIPPFHPNVPPASPSSQLLTPFSRSVASPQQQHSPPQSLRASPSHSRSLSQPAGFFSLDALPPLSPSPYTNKDSSLASSPQSEQVSPVGDVTMDEQQQLPQSRPATSSTPPPTPPSNSLLLRSNSGRASADGLPPRKAHRRSHSDIPFGFADSLAQMLGHPPLPPRPQGGTAEGLSGRESFGFGLGLGKQQVQQSGHHLVKQEWDWDPELARGGEGTVDKKGDGGDYGDDLIDAYMNLDGLDTLDSSEAEEKREDMDSRASGTKTSEANSSENESECSVNENANSGQVLRKRSPSSIVDKVVDTGRRLAAGDFVGSQGNSRHFRSISMDSFMRKMDFSEDLLKFPPSPGVQHGQLSCNSSLDGGTIANINAEAGNGGFSGSEMKKIMANAKLAEIAMTDPKRAKRILANRQSAARSKERKMRYISELEHKVQTLQTEATTLSAQLTILQRDSSGLTNQNNELKFRLQAMEQQAQLRDALHEALTAEVQRLRLATAQLGDGRSFKGSNPQMGINSQSFQLHQQLVQSSQQPTFQAQTPPPQAEQQQQPQDKQQQTHPVARESPSKSC